MQAIAELVNSNSKTEEEIIKLIDAELKKGANVDSEVKAAEITSTLLNFAARNIKPKIVNFLLRRGAKADAVSSDANTPLQGVCWAGRVDTEGDVFKIAIDLLLRDADVHCRNSKKSQPLYYASANGLVSVVEELLTKKPDLDRGGAGIGSPLCAAVVCGHLDVCRLLLDAGANVEGSPSSPRNDKMTPLLLACQRGDVNIVKLLLERNADPTRKDATGNNAVHHAAAIGSLECLNMLLKTNKAKCSEFNNNFETPLDLAIRHLNFDAVQFLLDQGPTIYTTTFQWFVSRRHMGMLKMLVMHPKMYSLVFRDLCLIVLNDFVDGLEFVLTEVPSLKCSKDELQRLINEFAKSTKAKDLLKERMENQDDEGNLVQKLKMEVKEEVLESVPEKAGSRRARSPSPKSKKEEKNDTKPKPKNSAAAKKKK